ncbi:MAG: signal peptide peptidase SppA, partial [Bacteroidales bacterium]|nr:signal peptide peptidase SppA [Bacteroidales bacterium]
MKNFFKMFLATLLAMIVMFLLMGFISMIFAVSILASEGKATVIAPKSVLKLELNNVTIEERAVDNPFEQYALPGMFSNPNAVGLNTIIAAIKKAKEDANISGIYLDFSAVTSSFATLEEIRNQLLDFKESGKFVYCYSDGLTQKSYYLATAADKIYLHPQGLLDIRGLASEIVFYKNLLDKLDIEVQIVRHGTYKSAVEPFMLDKMSEANKEQVQVYLGSMWNHIVDNISKSRSMTTDEINVACDSLLMFQNNALLLSKGFVDNLIFKDQFLDTVRFALELDSAQDIRFVSLKEYKKTIPQVKVQQEKIAIIYAEGNIIDGKGDSKSIGWSTAEEIAKARKDKNIKAIVFRINSGGGSALASESIWREVELAQQEKPVVVSMGDYAASGGYYIACAADYIVAQPTTITGSIGVFGVIPNVGNLLSNKLGITVDRVKTNAHADAISTTRRMTDYERAVMQQYVENTYSLFTQRVADGRNISKSYVDSIGQGRVWSGVDALRLNLADTLGGIDVAVKKAAQLAEISDYALIERPIMKDFFQEFAESLMNSRINSQMKTSGMKQLHFYFRSIESVMEMEGVQARIPY